MPTDGAAELSPKRGGEDGKREPAVAGDGSPGGRLAAGAQGLLREEIQADIDTAAQRAAESPYLTLEEAAGYVYAG